MRIRKKTKIIFILVFVFIVALTLTAILSFIKIPSVNIQNNTTSNFSVVINPGVQCLDGVDNDSDGKIDYPSDPGCSSATDNNETDPVVPVVPSGGGGGGGGSSYTPPKIVTQITFTGRAYPLSKVGVLKDGQLAISTIAGPDANFKISLTGLSTGNYTFSVFSEDAKRQRSTPFVSQIYITRGASTTVSGIFIAPTIAVDKSEVKRGDNIVIFGQSAPSASITISVASEEVFVKTKASAKDGTYLYNFDTTPLEIGQHATKSKATVQDEISSFGDAVNFTVGKKTVVSQPVKIQLEKCDLDGDDRINLVDFSIVAYWYKRPLSNEFAKLEAQFLNGDGKVDLVDFSIMAYYWTG